MKKIVNRIKFYSMFIYFYFKYLRKDPNFDCDINTAKKLVYMLFSKERTLTKRILTAVFLSTKNDYFVIKLKHMKLMYQLGFIGKKLLCNFENECKCDAKFAAMVNRFDRMNSDLNKTSKRAKSQMKKLLSV